jgi:type II secretory pathway pseudopilin PulG
MLLDHWVDLLNLRIGYIMVGKTENVYRLLGILLDRGRNVTHIGPELAIVGLITPPTKSVFLGGKSNTIQNMKPFTKPEIISLIVIFSILIAVSVPNFILSLRRARDQVRRDDMGVLEHALDLYSADFRAFPLSSSDGLIMDCLKPGDKPQLDSKSGLIVNLIPCQWGKDTFTDLVNGKIYMSILPREPDYQKGAKYLYFSDGNRYQIYGVMEGMDEAEIDPKIVARGLTCGNKICNVGRSYNVPTDISIEEYVKTLLKK